ncbi:MAG: hypothetical protein RLZZ142_1985 [Verrucomicrobiota bacterium]
MVRFEFPAAKEQEVAVVVIRFGAFDATLEVRDAAGKLMASKFEDEVYGMGVTYEDLALRFVYWMDGEVEGEERWGGVVKCWKVRVRCPEAVRSAYRQVVFWVTQEDGIFVKSEAYGEETGKEAKPVRLISVRGTGHIGQVTVPKQLKAEFPRSEGDPVYLDVDVDRTSIREPR